MNLVEKTTAAFQQAGQAIGRDLLQELLVVGVSGGPDSLALLYALTHVTSADRLTVAHMDHQLRPDSAEEALFVARLAADLGLSFRSGQADVASLAQKERMSIEEAGRFARYKFLSDVAGETGARFIAVGHNAEDQVETILMHMLRGSGTAGLRGMQLVTAVPNADDLWLLRPLLEVTREEIEAYCRECGLAPRRDPSNTDTTYYRNRLRNELMPLLAAYNPQIRQRVREMGIVLAAEDDLLSRLTEEAWKFTVMIETDGQVELERTRWLSQPLAIRRRLLRRAATAVAPGLPNLRFQTIESARRLAESGRTGSQVSFPGGLRFRIVYDVLVISHVITDRIDDSPQLPGGMKLDLTIPGEIDLLCGWQLVADREEAVDLDRIRQNRDPWTCYLTVEDDQSLEVRPRRPGEMMRPLGLGGEAKIKDIMINRKVPAAARKRWPIVATESHALWIVGHTLDERAKVNTSSRRIVRLSCRKR